MCVDRTAPKSRGAHPLTLARPLERARQSVDDSKYRGYTEGYVEVATFTREDVYLEYSARDIEDEYLWGETYDEMKARIEPYRGPGGLLGGGTH